VPGAIEEGIDTVVESMCGSVVMIMLMGFANFVDGRAVIVKHQKTKQECKN
jgi:hypothetical protein